MFTHQKIWTAIDRLAESFGYSPSGLAKKAGLDPTTFNKSKRTSADGKPRWPSTESIAKILSVTGASMVEFTALIDDKGGAPGGRACARALPLIDTASAGRDGYFDEHGLPCGKDWGAFEFPKNDYLQGDTPLYALEMSGSKGEPLYRDGDILIIAPQAEFRAGDRVIVKMQDGEIIIGTLQRRNAARLEIRPAHISGENRTLIHEDIFFTARIVWASQ